MAGHFGRHDRMRSVDMGEGAGGASVSVDYYKHIQAGGTYDSFRPDPRHRKQMLMYIENLYTYFSKKYDELREAFIMDGIHYDETVLNRLLLLQRKMSQLRLIAGRDLTKQDIPKLIIDQAIQNIANDLIQNEQATDGLDVGQQVIFANNEAIAAVNRFTEEITGALPLTEEEKALYTEYIEKQGQLENEEKAASDRRDNLQPAGSNMPSKGDIDLAYSKENAEAEAVLKEDIQRRKMERELEEKGIGYYYRPIYTEKSFTRNRVPVNQKEPNLPDRMQLKDKDAPGTLMNTSYSNAPNPTYVFNLPVASDYHFVPMRSVRIHAIDKVKYERSRTSGGGKGLEGQGTYSE